MYRNIFSLQMFLYPEISLNDCAPLVTAVPGKFNYTGCKTSIMSFVFWSYLVGSLSLCFLSVYYLCIFCNTHRKRSFKFFLITPLTHLCRLPSTEWYVHMCFKTLFPASTPVLLCYILIICCIRETQLYSSEVM